MTAPSGGPFFHDLIEGVVIWEDSDPASVAKAPIDATVAINTPAEATELPVQGLAESHVIEGAHELAHGDGVLDGHHGDAHLVSGEAGHAGEVVTHDDSSGSTSG